MKATGTWPLMGLGNSGAVVTPSLNSLTVWALAWGCYPAGNTLVWTPLPGLVRPRRMNDHHRTDLLHLQTCLLLLTSGFYSDGGCWSFPGMPWAGWGMKTEALGYQAGCICHLSHQSRGLSFVLPCSLAARPFTYP